MWGSPACKKAGGVGRFTSVAITEVGQNSACGDFGWVLSHAVCEPTKKRVLKGVSQVSPESRRTSDEPTHPTKFGTSILPFSHFLSSWTLYFLEVHFRGKSQLRIFRRSTQEVSLLPSLVDAPSPEARHRPEPYQTPARKEHS